MPNIRQTHCLNCPGGQSQNPACSRANQPLSKEFNSSSVLLIFQAPGIDEWNTGQPIISQGSRSAAARIRNSLVRLGKSRGDFDITNSVQCYPGKNSTGRDKRPSETMRKNCQSWLATDIASHYQTIVVFGACAKKSVLALGYSNDSRFKFLNHPSGGLTNLDLDNALR
ncbi:MAG TPA: uracil-DNA glycosylase family protein [Methylobacter sp.]|jgi:uracil-DNA glycosylase family 4